MRGPAREAGAGAFGRVVGVAALAAWATAACQAPTGAGGSDAGLPVEPTLPAEDPFAADGTARRLEAGWTSLDGGDVAGAVAMRDELLAESAAGALEAGERLDLALLDAGIALAAGDVDGAAERVDAVGSERAGHLPRHAMLRAEVAAARGDRAGAVATLLGFPVGSSADAVMLGRAIWRHGSRAHGHELEVRGRDAATVAERAWWFFLRRFNEALTPSTQRRLWAGWRQGHPAHPAAVARPAGLDEPAPGRVALLLPLSGRLAGAGEAVRDGFMAAYFAAGPPPGQSVLLYDTGTASVEALYEEVLADGARAIVGPLSKDNAARMWALDPVVPTVALNAIPEAEAIAERPARLVQFALAVEDEGRALAGRLGTDGMRRVVVFRAGADWSERAATALEAALPDGVTVVDARVFPDVREVTAVVGDALAIEESQARQTALARLFGGRAVEFTARRRADVDGVVALLDGGLADSLAAALRFHYAAGLPVYGSSQALRDGARALEGMRVCDMPWRLFPPPLKDALQGPFEGIGDTAESLFAFGVDAFRIVNRLSHLAASPEHRIMGASGVLGLGGDGVSRRKPAWAVVRGGAFHPLPRRLGVPLLNE